MKIFLIIVLLFFIKLTFAQDNDNVKLSKPINSGFVFIDGKYIEPPYKFSYKKQNVYINGIQASTTPEIKKNFQKGKKKYIEPIYKLDKNLGWFEYLSMINPLTGNKYHTDYMNYLYTKYPNTSKEQFEKFIRDLPFVKSYDNGYLITYNGETHKYFLTYRSFAIKSQRNKIEKENIQFYEKVLAQGGTIIYFKDNLPSINRLDTLETIYLLEDLYKNTDSINWNYLTDKYIYNQSIPKEYMIDLLQNIKNDKILKQRFEVVKQKYNKLKNAINENSFKVNILQKNKSSTSFSPKENSVTYFCPYTFDASFSDYNQIINVFQNRLSGYNYSVSYYVDNIDDDCLNFSLDALKNISSGIVCLDAHGTSNYGGQIALFYSKDKSACDLLMQNQADLGLGQMTFQGDTNIYWVVLAGQEWFTNNWKNRLTQNNSLVFVLTCEGAVLLEAYGGSAAFAYLNMTNTSQNISDLNKILKKMNGESNYGLYRTAWDAFVNSSFNNLTIYSSSPITLCPAPSNYYPANGQTVGLSGVGYFEIDTYCDATIPINEYDPYNSPISFTYSHPQTQITAQWDDPDGDGLSNKITFQWTASNNDIIYVHINHLKFQSAPSINGQYHVLDYDKVTPNNEDGDYSFTISNDVPSQPPIADFSFTTNNNIAYFQDLSTNTPTLWYWDFGDGQTSTVQNPIHTYYSTGTYNVTLTVSNSFGTSSKTKSVSITNTPQTVTVSGHVQSNEDFSPIVGATVSCNVSSTTTDYTGNYALQVPYGWSGTVTGSATGFLSQSCSCSNLIANKICDFGLFKNNLYIYTSENVHSVGVGFSLAFNASYTEGDHYYWEIMDKYDNLIYDESTITPVMFYTFYTQGTFYIRVTVDNLTSPDYEIIAINLNCDCAGFSILSSCHVIKTNQPVTFWNVGNVPEDIKNDNCITSHASCYAPTGRRWITAYGTPYEYRTNVYPWGGTNPPDPWYYTTSFSHGGKYSIKYEIITEQVVYEHLFHPHIECWGAPDVIPYTGCEHYGEIIVVDCNAQSQCYSFGCPNSIPGWDENGNYHLWSGSFYLNNQSNGYINSYDLTLSACNDIILSDGFETNGTHELILENEDFNCHPNKDNIFTNYLQTHDSLLNNFEDNNNIIVYPNPFNDKINIKSLNNTIQKIKLCNMLGKTIIEKNIFTKENILETNTVNEGIYILELTIENKEYRYKLIKQLNL